MPLVFPDMDAILLFFFFPIRGSRALAMCKGCTQAYMRPLTEVPQMLPEAPAGGSHLPSPPHPHYRHSCQCLWAVANHWWAHPPPPPPLTPPRLPAGGHCASPASGSMHCSWSTDYFKRSQESHNLFCQFDNINRIWGSNWVILCSSLKIKVLGWLWYFMSAA